jgi:hypothetical protein
VLLGLRVRLAEAESIDVQAAHAFEPYSPVELGADDGPVQLSVEYYVAAAELSDFRLVARELERSRRRAGAMHWALYADVRDAQRQVETFIVSSWSEHLRSGARGTEADRAVIDRVRAYHAGSDPPIERALVSERHRHRPSPTKERA